MHIFRVRHQATFAALARTRAVRSGPIIVRAARDVSPGPQIAFAIGKPIGNAVVRNRLRRQLRSIARETPTVLQSNAAYLIGATPEVRKISFAELQEHVLLAFQKTSAA